MIENVAALQKHIDEEGIGFVDKKVLDSILKKREHFSSETIKLVESILKLPTTPKMREEQFKISSVE